MAEIKDQIGRIGNFQDAAMEKLSSMLKAAVGNAVKYASEKTKSSVSDKDYEKLSKALEDLGDDLKANLKETEKFVNQVKEAIKSFDKAKQSRGAASSDSKGNLESIQREQTKILGMILENQKRAQATKFAKYTSGGSSLSSKNKLSLGDLGFKPKGTDRVPAMLSPNEFIVNSRGASRNRGILEKINRGYRLGGIVKPRYLEDGTPGPTGATPMGSLEAFRRFHATADIEIDKVEVNAAAKAEAEKVGQQITEHINKGIKSGTNRELASWFTGMSTALMGGGSDFLQGLFAGSVTDAMDFQREMRHIAFQTQGITGDFREMQSNFSDLGKVAAETGKSISVMQKVYMSNLKKGFKDNKDGMKVMKSGLFLSTMIGSEAEQTADLFGDWHRTLALSSNEMGELARGMRNVALNTGVTGDELLGAMKSSEGILKNLRQQGNLTAGVSKTVIEMMAEARKTGFEDSTGKILNALSGTSNIMEADSATQGLIYTISNRMGGDATNSVLSGTFMKDRANLAGFSSELMNLVGSLSDGAIKSLEDFDKLSDAQKRDLTLRLRGYGLTIAQAESLIKTTQKASKGLAGNIEELDRIGSSKFATKAEKELASKQKSQAYLGASLDYLAAIGDEAKDKSLSDALRDSSTSADFKDKRQDFTAMAGALTSEMKSAYGIGGTSEQMAQQLANMDPQKAAELNALILGDQLNRAAKEKGVSLDMDYASEIRNALARGDNARYRELVGEAQKKASEIAVEDQAASTPEAKLALEINKLNETIRGYTSSFVRNMVDYIGWVGLLYIQIGLLISTLASTMGTNLLDFGSNLKGMFSKGGTLSTMFTPFMKGFTRARAAGGGIGGALQRGAYGQMMSSGMGRQIMAFARPLGGILQKALGPAVLVMGGIKGAMEAKDAGRTKTEGAILGALTGGAKTGSFMSSTLGLKKGGAADKALGVAGGAAWGAAAGAAIGSAFFGVGAVPGAIIGAIIGGVMEMVKIITEGTNILQDIFSPIQVIVDFIYNRLVNLWDVVAGIFTLDFGRVFKGIFNLIVGGLLIIPRLIGATIQSVFIGIPKLILRTLSLIWEIPRMLGQALYNGIASLADNEWVGPIFATLRDALGALGEGLMAIWTPISEVFRGLYKVFDEIGKAIFGTAEGSALLSGVLWVLKTAIWGLSKVISVLLYPVVILAKVFGFVLKIIGNLISGIISPFKWLYDTLVGHSIIPDLCYGIVGFFGRMAGNVLKFMALLPLKALKFLGGLPFKLAKGLGDVFFKAPAKVFGKMFKFLNSDVAKSGVKTMGNISHKVLGGLNQVFFKAPTKIFGKMFKFLASKTFRSGIGMISGKFAGFFEMFKSNLSSMTKFFGTSWYAFLNNASGGMFGKLVSAVKNSNMWKIVNDFLIKPISEGLSWLGNKAGEVFSWLGKKAGDIFKGSFNWMKNQASRWLPGFGGAAGGAPAAQSGSVVDDVAKAAAGSAADDAVKAGAKATAAAASSADDLAKSAPAALGFLGKSSKMIGGLARKLPVVGPLLDFGIRKVSGQSTGKALAGTAAGTAGGLGGAALGATIGTLIFPGVGTAIGGLLGGVLGGVGAGMASDVVYDKVAGTGSGATVNKAAETAAEKIGTNSAAASTPVGQHAVPALRPEDNPVPEVQPVHLRDITDSILRDRAGTGGHKLQSDELSRIEEASFRQVEELEHIREGIAEMVALLKPKGTGLVGGSSEMGPGRTKDPKRPMHAAQFGKMKYGRAGGNANRSLVNNGEV